MADVVPRAAAAAAEPVALRREVSYCGKFRGQFVALMKKNFILQKRNVGATMAQLLVGPLFIIVLFIIGSAIKANQSEIQEVVFTEHPKPLVPPTLTKCTPYEGKQCYDFAYSPVNYATNAITSHMMNIAGIDASRVKAIPNVNDVDDWLMANENTTQIVVIFPEKLQLNPLYDINTTSTYQYTLQMNTTADCGFGPFSCNAELKEEAYRAPMQQLVNAAIMRHNNKPDATIRGEYKNFPHPAIRVGYDVMSDSGPSMMFIAAAFNFVVQMYLIAEEKERNLRSAMEKMGMLDSVYWLTWYLFDAIMNGFVVIMLCMFGAMFQFELFLENDFGLVFFHLWLCANLFTAMGFFLVTFTSKADSAVSIGLLFFVVMFLFGGPILAVGFTSGDTDPYKIIRDIALTVPTLAPAAIFYGGLTNLISASSGQTNLGMRWEQRMDNILTESPDGNVFTFEDFFIQSILQTIYHLALAWYFDNVLPDTYGRRKNVLFFLFPSYWTGQSCGRSVSNQAFQHVPGADEDPDVTAEAERITQRKWTSDADAPAIIIEGLVKTFVSGGCCGSGCCGGQSQNAVDGITYGVEKDQAFVLLGHNGAGKTTTINMLVGNLTVSDGRASVMGLNVKSQMRSINQIMGVCPQHDILWPALTGQEHLELFCRLRGFTEEEVQVEVEQRLKDVLLNDPKTRAMPSRAYSGGMQRRLSIAISLLGNPKVVYLDEPTTGMDPVTRREVWNMIQRAKKGRVIILTTHSMEEADVLGDNIGVMSKGKLQAFGSATRLKKQFGGGYKMTMFINDPQKEKEAVAFVSTWKSEDETLSVSCKVEHRVDRGGVLGPVLFLSLPKIDDELSLLPFFQELEQRKADLGVSDFSVGLSTLEEVFLELSKRDHFIPGVSKEIVRTKVPLPDGVDVGSAINFKDKWGRDTSVTVSAKGIKDGFELVEVEGPDESPTNPNVAIKVDEKIPLQAGGVSKAHQAKALCFKTLQWQKRHKAQLMANLCFPVFIMILLIVLDTLVFGLLRESALCGAGVKYKDCKAKGYNLTCAANALSMASKFETPPKLGVGLIQRWGVGGVGINPNCGEDDTSSRVCFEGLEKPRFHGILSKAPTSTRTISPDETITNLYQRFRTKVAASKCAENLANSMRCRPRRDGGAYYCTGVEARKISDCQKECQEVTKAKEKKDATDETQVTASSSPLAVCLPAADASRRRLSSSGPRRLLELTATEQKYYDIYLKKLAEKEKCDLVFLQEVASIMDNNGQDIGTKIANAAATVQATGMFQTMTASNPPYPYQPYAHEPIADEGAQGLFSAITKVLVDNKAINPIFIGFRGPKAFCEAVAFRSGSNPTLVPNITAVFTKDLSAPTNVAFNNLCHMIKNMDTVRAFSFAKQGTTDALDDALYKNWFGKEIKHDSLFKEKSKIGYRWHYIETDFMALDVEKEDYAKSQFDYTIYHNTSATQRDDTYNWLALTQLVNNGIMKKQINKDASVMTKRFPTKFKCNRDEWLDNNMRGKLECPSLLFGFLGLNIMDFFLGAMMPWFMILYGYSMTVLVTYEKEHKLRIIMQMQGLKSSVYFWVNYAYFLGQFLLLCFILTVFGLWANLNMFKLHDFGVVFLFFFLWGNAMIAFFLTVATLFNSTRLAQTMTFLIILIVVFVGNTIVQAIVQNPAATESSWTAMMLLPPFVMMRFTNVITTAAASFEKVTFANIGTVNGGSMAQCLGYLAIHWFFWMFLRWYLEQVVVGGFGTPKHPLFLFQREFWDGLMGKSAQTKAKATLQDLEDLPEDEKKAGLVRPRDVEKEHARIIDSLKNPAPDNMDAVRIVNMHKQFPGVNPKDPPKTAVRSVSFGVKQRECFGLLGHNGAGKTTVINMMTGLFPPTSGTGLIGNYDIATDLDKIYSTMGVCPQHNILWGELSAKEHQEFFGRLKGRSGARLQLEVQENLNSVNLADCATRPSAGFSGGMQRRLSVANSIVGNPGVVYMDEPSTGLDPASRRQLWDVISRAKKDKSVILTTHSMEEADVLCDRLGIMSAGRLLCVGPSFDLKRRFGKGYTCVLATKVKDLSNTSAVHSWITDIFPSAVLLEDPISGTFKYEIDRREVVISEAFSAIVSGRDKIGLADWGFTETTLEEVFLKLSHLHGNQNPVDNSFEVAVEKDE
jgi:ABC-type multidrug transport system ATPase subunit